MDIRQKKTMSLDHVLVCVHDYEQTLNHYQNMGFARTQISYHPWGTATCFLMFEDTFIELLGIADASKIGTHEVNGFCFGRQVQTFLDKGEDGIALIALHSKDAHADFARLSPTHTENQGIVDFRRTIKLEDGSLDEVVVSIALFIDSKYPEASSFVCHQHRPDLIWVDEWKSHPNGTTHIAAVTYMADDFSVLAQRWQAEYGDAVIQRTGELSVDTQSGLLRALTPAQFASAYAGIELPESHNPHPHVAALTLGTRSLTDLIAILETNRVPHIQGAGRVLVSPQVTGNVIFEFIQN